MTADVVRVGDLVDNAGAAAPVAVYRSPDLGTTGALPVAQVLSVLRAKQVIGVMTGDIREVQVTRLARSLASKEIENAVASSLERRFGLEHVGDPVGQVMRRAHKHVRIALLAREAYHLSMRSNV